MKKLILIAVAALIVIADIPSVQAQPQTAVKPSPDMVVLAGYKDGMLMKNGKVLMVRNGQGKVMDKGMVMAFPNGTTVMGDGSITKKDGTPEQMKNGTGVDMEGNITRTEAEFKTAPAKHK